MIDTDCRGKESIIIIVVLTEWHRNKMPLQVMLRVCVIQAGLSPDWDEQHCWSPHG